MYSVRLCEYDVVVTRSAGKACLVVWLRNWRTGARSPSRKRWLANLVLSQILHGASRPETTRAYWFLGESKPQSRRP